MLPLLVIATLLGGCAAAPPAESSVQVIPAERFEAVYQAAIDTLRDGGFRVDRQDYRFGRVTTHPLDSPTLFEPWRPLNSTAAQTAASTLGHLQRRVIVMLDPADAEDAMVADGSRREESGGDETRHGPSNDEPSAGSAYTLTVEVILERRQLPLRRLTGTAERRRIDLLREVPAEWAERGITADYAEPIGRDTELERRLAGRILARAEAR